MGNDDALDEEDRAAILKRRAVFVVSAIAGLTGVVGCGDGDRPERVLVQPRDTSGTSTATSSPAPVDAGVASQDAGVAGSASVSASSTESATAEPTAPQPCLDVPPPGPCLKVAPPGPCLRRAPPAPCLAPPPPRK